MQQDAVLLCGGAQEWVSGIYAMCTRVCTRVSANERVIDVRQFLRTWCTWTGD